MGRRGRPSLSVRASTRSRPKSSRPTTNRQATEPKTKNLPRRGVSTVRVFPAHPLITARFCDAAHSKIQKTGLGGGRSNVRMLQDPKIQITHVSFPKPTQTNSENQDQKNRLGEGGGAVSLCPCDFNPTFDGPHRTGKPRSPRSKNGLGGGEVRL